MKTVLKSIKLKDFDKEKFIDKLEDNSFSIDVKVGCVLRKGNYKDGEYVEKINEEIEEYTLEGKVNYLLENPEKVMFLPFMIEYDEEALDYNDNFELFSKDYFIDFDSLDEDKCEYFDDNTEYYEKHDFRGCIELQNGKRFFGDDKDVDFGGNNYKDFGVIVEIEGDNILFKKATHCYFNTYQQGAMLIENAGQFEQDLLDFVNNIL